MNLPNVAPADNFTQAPERRPPLRVVRKLPVVDPQFAALFAEHASRLTREIFDDIESVPTPDIDPDELELRRAFLARHGLTEIARLFAEHADDATILAVIHQGLAVADAERDAVLDEVRRVVDAVPKPAVDEWKWPLFATRAAKRVPGAPELFDGDANSILTVLVDWARRQRLDTSAIEFEALWAKSWDTPDLEGALRLVRGGFRLRVGEYTADDAFIRFLSVCYAMNDGFENFFIVRDLWATALGMHRRRLRACIDVAVGRKLLLVVSEPEGRRGGVYAFNTASTDYALPEGDMATLCDRLGKVFDFERTARTSSAELQAAWERAEREHGWPATRWQAVVKELRSACGVTLCRTGRQRRFKGVRLRVPPWLGNVC